MYSRLLTFGDLIPLTINCNVNKLILTCLCFIFNTINLLLKHIQEVFYEKKRNRKPRASLLE